MIFFVDLLLPRRSSGLPDLSSGRPCNILSKIVYNISRRLLSPSYITLIIYIYKYKIIAYYSFLCYRCNFCMLTKLLQKKKNTHVIMRNLTYVFSFFYYTPDALSYYYLSSRLNRSKIIIQLFTYTRGVLGDSHCTHSTFLSFHNSKPLSANGSAEPRDITRVA